MAYQLFDKFMKKSACQILKRVYNTPHQDEMS